MRPGGHHRRNPRYEAANPARRIVPGKNENSPRGDAWAVEVSFSYRPTQAFAAAAGVSAATGSIDTL